MEKFVYKYQLHGVGMKEIAIDAETKRDADWKLFRHFEIQQGAVFSVSVVMNFIEKLHISKYGDICISFKNYKGEECFCTIYNQK